MKISTLLTVTQKSKKSKLLSIKRQRLMPTPSRIQIQKQPPSRSKHASNAEKFKKKSEKNTKHTKSSSPQRTKRQEKSKIRYMRVKSQNNDKTSSTSLTRKEQADNKR